MWLEVGGQRERSPRSEVRDQRAEDRGRRSEVRDQPPSLKLRRAKEDRGQERNDAGMR